jgi:hypothetical protein
MGEGVAQQNISGPPHFLTRPELPPCIALGRHEKRRHGDGEKQERRQESVECEEGAHCLLRSSR